MSDLTAIADLMLEMLERENTGDVSYFDRRLASHMAMRRSNGNVVGRSEFLGDVAPGGDRQCVDRPCVALHGSDRATVSCQVRSGGRTVDNYLLFVRQPEAPEGWLVLAWVNELAAPAV